MPLPTPSIPDAKSNKAFCMKVGTSVTFMSSSNNTGFVIDYGGANPFDHDGAIIGGSDRPITVTRQSIPVVTATPSELASPGTVYGIVRKRQRPTDHFSRTNFHACFGWSRCARGATSLVMWKYRSDTGEACD